MNGRTYVFELELDGLVNRAVPEAQAVSKYPSIRRDLAIVVKQSIAAGEILAAIENIGVNHLVGLNLFDVYQGAGVAEGHRSLALSMTLQHAERTLEEQEINAAVAAVVDMLTSEFGATLRSDAMALTKAELAEQLNEKFGMHKRDAKELVECF